MDKDKDKDKYVVTISSIIVQCNAMLKEYKDRHGKHKQSAES